ncbi:MAG: ribosomal protein S18-alanine N-acetyltransferase [Nitrospirota bacterium]
MQEDDIPDILEIERRSFTTPWSETSFLNELQKTFSITKVAVLENHIIGYFCANYIFDEGHILNLAVHHDFRRQGIGTALMNNAINELKEKDCRFLYLEVRVSNIAAIKFYERFGFRIIGFRRNYYINPKEDAALMMLGL